MIDFKQRIRLNIPLEELSKQICKKYCLGEFLDNKIVEIGYEDFNYLLTTNKNKFFIKIFSSFRTDCEAKQLAARMDKTYQAGISCPKIYKINNKCLWILKIKNVKYRIIVMEYLEGNNFFELKTLPNSNEL